VGLYDYPESAKIVKDKILFDIGLMMLMVLIGWIFGMKVCLCSVSTVVLWDTLRKISISTSLPNLLLLKALQTLDGLG